MPGRSILTGFGRVTGQPENIRTTKIQKQRTPYGATPYFCTRFAIGSEPKVISLGRSRLLRSRRDSADQALSAPTAWHARLSLNH